MSFSKYENIFIGGLIAVLVTVMVMTVHMARQFHAREDFNKSLVGKSINLKDVPGEIISYRDNRFNVLIFKVGQPSLSITVDKELVYSSLKVEAP